MSTCPIYGLHLFSSSVSSFMTMLSQSRRYRGTHALPVVVMEGPLLDKTREGAGMCTCTCARTANLPLTGY